MKRYEQTRGGRENSRWDRSEKRKQQKGKDDRKIEDE